MPTKFIDVLGVGGANSQVIIQILIALPIVGLDLILIPLAEGCGL